MTEEIENIWESEDGQWCCYYAAFPDDPDTVVIVIGDIKRTSGFALSLQDADDMSWALNKALLGWNQKIQEQIDNLPEDLFP